MTDQFDFDAFVTAAEQAVEDAEASQVRRNFGKLYLTPRYIQWVTTVDPVTKEESRSPKDVDVKEYTKLSRGERSLEITFGVDIQEFNTDLEWQYERRVMVGSTDWWTIFKPGLESLEGWEGCLEKGKLPDTLRNLNGKYVLAEDVMQAPTKKQPNPQYRTIKIAQVYDSRESCYEAWKEVFGGSASGTQVVENVPPGDWGNDWGDVVDDFNVQLSQLVGTAGPSRIKGIKKLAEDFAIIEDGKPATDWVKGELEKLEAEQ